MNDDPGDDDIRLVVTVTRTGGFAGLRREWQAVAPPAEITVLRTLVEACAWNDEAPESTTYPDGFVWHVGVTEGSRLWSQTIPDTEAQGAWSDLIEMVRATAKIQRDSAE